MRMSTPSEQTLFAMEPQAPRRASFGVADVLRLVFKYWPLLLVCTLLVGALAIGGALRQPRLYTAQAQVLVKMDQGSPSLLSGVAAYSEAVGQQPPARRIETEMTLLRKRSNLEQVIQRWHLRPEHFKRSAVSIAFEPLADAIGALLPARKPEDDDGALPPDPLADAWKAFDASLAIEPVRSKAADVTSNVISVSLTGTDPTLTRDALASLLQAYHEIDAAQSDQLIQRAAEVLRAQTDDALAELYRSEQEYIRFTTGAAAAALAGQQIKVPGESSASSIPPPTAKLRSDLQDLQTRLDTLRETYTDRHEAVRTLRDAIDKLRARMLQETRDMVRASVNVDVLDRRRNQAQARYIELQRKLDQIELLFKVNLSSVESQLNTEPPRAPEPASRLGVRMTMLFGPLVGLMLGVLLACVLEWLDRRLQSADSVRESLGLDVLAIVPEMARPSGRGERERGRVRERGRGRR